MIETLVSALYALIVGSLAATAVLAVVYLLMSLRLGSAIDYAESRPTLTMPEVVYFLGRGDAMKRLCVFAASCLAAMLAVGLLVEAPFLRALFAASCGGGSVFFLVRAVRGLKATGEEYHSLTGTSVRDASNEVLDCLNLAEDRR